MAWKKNPQKKKTYNEKKWSGRLYFFPFYVPLFYLNCFIETLVTRVLIIQLAFCSRYRVMIEFESFNIFHLRTSHTTNILSFPPTSPLTISGADGFPISFPPSLPPLLLGTVVCNIVTEGYHACLSPFTTLSRTNNSNYHHYSGPFSV